MTIQWNSKKIQIKNLKANPKNPRYLSKDQSVHLQNSLENFGVCEPIVINTDGMIIGGHQRVKILKKMKVKEVDAYFPDRDLTEKESDELCIRLNKNSGLWDWEKLANEFECTDLLEFGFDEKELLGDYKTENSEEGSKEKKKKTKECPSCGHTF